jgi:hypothetical protein
LFFGERDAGNKEAMIWKIAEQRMSQVKIQNQTLKRSVDKNLKSYCIGINIVGE